VSAKHPPTVRLEELRRFAAALVSASGVKAERAAALASQLIWFDAAGYPLHGVATLADLLDKIASGEIDPTAEGKVGPEKTATAVIDGQNGIPGLILARAAGIAVEKARESGVGLVRVTGIGPIGSVAPIVADIGIGPMIGAAFGPNGAWASALPSADGPPWIADSAIDPGSGPAFAPWTVMVPNHGCLIQAVAVASMEPLASLQLRVAEAAKAAPDLSLRPDRLESRRREARESGVTLDPRTRSALNAWARKLGIEPLS
jgi:LDH2 family malate/lactate/ureidoglycolate dehydrogenase